VRIVQIVSLAALLVAFVPAAAPAQFTSTVRAPRPEKPAVVEARQDSLRRADSTSVVERMSEMREWVDSAAQAIAADAPPTDSVALDSAGVAPAASGGEIAMAPAPGPPPARFEDGARAPDTATPLPLIALLGMGSMAAGALLRRRRR
jgi:hypothetical protein